MAGIASRRSVAPPGLGSPAGFVGVVVSRIGYQLLETPFERPLPDGVVQAGERWLSSVYMEFGPQDLRAFAAALFAELDRALPVRIAFQLDGGFSHWRLRRVPGRFLGFRRGVQPADQRGVYRSRRRATDATHAALAGLRHHLGAGRGHGAGTRTRLRAAWKPGARNSGGSNAAPRPARCWPRCPVSRSIYHRANRTPRPCRTRCDCYR